MLVRLTKIDKKKKIAYNGQGHVIWSDINCFCTEWTASGRNPLLLAIVESFHLRCLKKKKSNCVA